MTELQNLSDQRDQYIQQLLELGGLWDAVFESMSPEDWEKPHGADWVMPYLPYHMEYFDRLILFVPLNQGGDYPEENRHIWHTGEDINAWNKPFMKAFDPLVSPQDHIATWRTIQQDTLKLLRSFDEDELANRQIWYPLSGWVSVMDTLAGTIPHNWEHLIEVYCRLGRSDFPLVGYDLARTSVSFNTNIFAWSMLNHEAATEPAKIVMAFTEDDRLKWTFDIRDGAYSMHEGADEDAMLTITQSAVSLVKLLTGIHHPTAAIPAGDIALSNPELRDKLAHYFPIFALPTD